MEIRGALLVDPDGGDERYYSIHSMIEPTREVVVVENDPTGSPL